MSASGQGGTSGMRWMSGGCHCGAVRFETLLPRTLEVEDCNCTICSRTGFLHIIVPESRFRLVAGEANLGVYGWGTGVARHMFCRTCGVKAFYRPRSNPDGWSVNLRCLDAPEDFDAVTIVAFDGRNDWDASAVAIRNKSVET